MTWHDARNILWVAVTLLTAGGVMGRAEFKLRDASKRLKKMNLKIEDLTKEKVNLIDCGFTHDHFRELSDRREETLMVYLKDGDDRMRRIEELYRDTGQKIENLLTLLVQHINSNGSKSA